MLGQTTSVQFSCETLRERERERERETQRHRDTETQRHRDTEREGERLITFSLIPNLAGMFGYKKLTQPL